MPAPKEVLELIERFERNRDAYRSHEYNEAQVRLELINPFFKALGWDVYNEAGYAEAYKDVVHEDAIKVGGHAKAPDYSFRIGGTRKFFVEAKRPSVGIKDNIDAAYQLRRYAWSAKLPLSILTDFEEFAVYDCRVKPAKTDKASAARVLYLTVEEYADQWDEIATIFSQEAVLKGSFDRYAESTKRKKGTAEVDDAFLKEIENWRDVLARNIALRNTDLSTRELNFAVQRTIDRIIFLRICEDRGIEDYGQLMALQSGNRVYPRLCQILRRADERYNSGLFHFRKEKDRSEPPDDLTLSLTVDDKVLKEVFEDLYYPDSPYEFSVLPADILGHIYEQFLGKLIRLTPGHHAKVDDKPEVKKAGGVYYTPTYIVDYIVKHTVGKLLEGKTPQQVRTLYVLDPACGSGSFLLGAYQTLLDWHLDWYSQHDPEKHAKGRKPKIFHGPGGDWRLTTAEKKRILLNNIYGVDIDPQAVEVTKLSLLLKVLEGENEETLVKHLRLFHERALPDLADNIKCGNSLIGPDFYEGKQLSLIDEEERYRINAFDWNAEFPEIMAAGGFDAVIGNPPYSNHSARDSLRGFYRREGLTRELSSLTRTIDYCAGRYPEVSAGCKDSFKWFLHKAKLLVARDGRMGMIVPNTWFTHVKYRDLKSSLFEDNSSISVVDLGFWVFSVTVPTSIVIYCSDGKGERLYCDVKEVGAKESVLATVLEFQPLDSDGQITEPEVVRKYLRQWDTRKRVATLVTLREGQHIPRRALVEGHNPKLIPVIDSKNMGRYEFTWDPKYSFSKTLDGRSKFRTTAGRRLVIRKTGDSIVATVTPSEESYVLQSLYQSVEVAPGVDPGFLLGLLNSRFLTTLYQLSAFGQKGRTMAQFRKSNLDLLPMPELELSDLKETSNYRTMITLVERMLKLHRDVQAAKTDHEKSLIQRQINATDEQINQLVYELYGLTEEEGRLVEEQR